MCAPAGEDSGRRTRCGTADGNPALTRARSLVGPAPASRAVTGRTVSTVTDAAVFPRRGVESGSMVRDVPVTGPVEGLRGR